MIASSRPFALPPRPSAPAPTDDGASVWQPLQRVNAEKPAGATQDHAAAYTSAGGAMRASADIPAPPASVAVAPNDPPAAPPAAAPLPRLEPQPVVTLGAPVVAHPAAPREFAKQPLPPYVVEPPNIPWVQGTLKLTEGFQPIDNQHLVRPDGTLSLGTYGSVYVAGSTLEEVRDAVAAQLHVTMNQVEVADIKKQLVVDVLAYNSKVYYVITDGGGYGEQVYPIAVTGNETVLDAMSKINGLPAVSSKKRIWVARATANCDHPNILPVDWCGITHRGWALPTPTTRFSPATGFTSPPTRGSRPTASWPSGSTRSNGCSARSCSAAARSIVFVIAPAPAAPVPASAGDQKSGPPPCTVAGSNLG